MKSAGYDVVVLLNERFLNQISGALFYNGFLRINGCVELQEQLDPETLANIPEELHRFLVVNYRMKLNFEPSIDFLQSDTPGEDPGIRTLLSLRVYFWLWDGLEIKFDANLAVVTGISIDPGTNQFLVDYARSTVEDLSIKYRYNMDHSVTLQLDAMLHKAVQAYLQNQEFTFAFALPTVSPLLPYTKDLPENRMSVQVQAVKAVDATTMAIAVNLSGYQGGDPQALGNFARNCSAALAVPEVAMHKIYDFFWATADVPKQFGVYKSFNSDVVNEVVNAVGKVIDIGQRVAVEIASLGFVETHWEPKGLRFEVGADVSLKSKPEFDLMPGNVIKISKMYLDITFKLKVFLDVEYSVEIDPTGWLPDFIPDTQVCKDRREVKIFDLLLPFYDMRLKEGTGKVLLDENTQTLQAKVESLDLYWNFISFTSCPLINFPEWLFNKILDLCESSIAEAIPPLVLSPSLTVKVPLVPWVLHIDGKKLEIGFDEAVLAANLYFTELKKDLPCVPKYIVNVNNGEIHKIGCDSLLDTYEEHQRGYHLLNDAVNKGYDGCRRCLPAYHNR